MNSLFSSPSLDDLIRLLRAWRLWVAGALIGVLLGGLLFWLMPPPYRARATVNVDFNLEQAWPQETDRQQFYYLERETRKLEEIAWSDEVLQAVAAPAQGLTVTDLRSGELQLAQPAEAGWHFYAQDRDPLRAQMLASIWAQAFTEAAQADIQSQGGLSSFIRLEVTQAAALPVQRSLPLAWYLLAGMLAAWFLCAFAVLFLGLGGRSHARGSAVLG